MQGATQELVFATDREDGIALDCGSSGVSTLDGGGWNRRCDFPGSTAGGLDASVAAVDVPRVEGMPNWSDRESKKSSELFRPTESVEDSYEILPVSPLASQGPCVCSTGENGAHGSSMR